VGPREVDKVVVAQDLDDDVALAVDISALLGGGGFLHCSNRFIETGLDLITTLISMPEVSIAARQAAHPAPMRHIWRMGRT
jgi:hypothetical protein